MKYLKTFESFNTINEMTKVDRSKVNLLLSTIGNTDKYNEIYKKVDEFIYMNVIDPYCTYDRLIQDLQIKFPKLKELFHKKVNESIEEQIYKQVLDSIKQTFLEFEDNGWYWMTDITQPGISVWHMPNINCRMLKREHEYVPAELIDYIDVTGEIDSDGEIKYDTNEVNSDKPEVHQEVEDFITSIKRIHSENGLGFNFSYNNKGGEFRIVIQGRI